MTFRPPRRVRPLILPDHAGAIVSVALMSAQHGGGIYPPVISALTGRGLIVPRGDKGGFVPSAAALELLAEGRRRRDRVAV